MISIITLGILILFLLVGLGQTAQKDFKISPMIALLAFGLSIGLNFITPISIGTMITFSIGTLVFYLFALQTFIFNGKFSNQLLAFVVALIFAGVVYGATRLGILLNSPYFAEINIVYAVAIGLIAVWITKNAKYAFGTAVVGIMIAGGLTQIGSASYSLNIGFQMSVLAGGIALVDYTVMQMMGHRMYKVSEYMEVGKFDDEL